MPIKKGNIAKSVQKYLEEKYDTEIELVGAVYNFKDKNYGGVYKIDDVEFYAEKDGEDYIDTYPNEIWKRELITDYLEEYKEQFPRAIRIEANFVHSTGPEIEGLNIPRYDEVDSWLSLHITIDEPFNDGEHWDGIFYLANSVQGKSPHITSSFLFVEEAADKETLITCPSLDEKEIHTIEDAKNACDQSVFTGDERGQ